MAFLIAELLAALLVAALLGVVVGWLFTATRWRRRIDQLEDGWNSKLQLAERQTERLESQLQSAARERDKVGNAYREAERELAELRSQLAASSSRLASIEDKHQDLSAALAHQDDAGTSLRQDLSDSQAELQLREQELSRVSKDLQQTKERLAEQHVLEQRLELYQRQLGEMEELRENVHALREQLAAQERERARALSEKDGKVAELQSELQILSERDQEREERLRIATNSELQMRTELSRLTREISSLKTGRDAVDHERSSSPKTFTAATTVTSVSGGQHESPHQVADDLKKIAGIGPKLERLLNEHGVYRYRDIAAWGPSEIEHFSHLLGGFRGRIERDNWIAQATALSSAVEVQDN